jgi:5,10-methylenetetrahydromethanopterin reductase
MLHIGLDRLTAASQMKVGIWIQPTVEARVVAEMAQYAEARGADFVGITDGQMIWRDVYVALALAASRTSRVRLGPWVTNTTTRHPAVTANVIATLDELSEGRMFLGIGSGDDSVRTINRPPVTLDHLAETVRVIKDLMGGAPVSVDGNEWSISTARTTAPPVYWAASGPRSLRLAGRHADGVIHSGWLVPELMAEDLGYVTAGLSEAAVGGAGFARIFNTAVAIHPDREVALNWARAYAARAYIYGSSTRIPGWDESKRQALLSKYNYYKHFSAENDAANEVPKELIPFKAIAGTPDDAVQLLSSVRRAGYSHAALIPVGDFDTVTDLLFERVLPQLEGVAGGKG